jgi:hypothetical protein
MWGVDPHIFKTQLTADEAKVHDEGILSGTVTFDYAFIACAQWPRPPALYIYDTAHAISGPVWSNSAAYCAIKFLGPADLMKLHLASDVAKIHYDICICGPVALNYPFVALVQRTPPMEDCP